jgi:formylglycine-generating enzyme required for sulfatase activity
MGMRRPPRIRRQRTKAIHAAWLLFSTFVLVPSLHAAEGKRIAFVVGIGDYDNLAADKQLRNAVNDAEGVSAKLAEIGYQVTRAPNLTRSTFNAKWQNILNALTKDDTFVLYFSGHGIQISGQNYLLPRDIPFLEYGRDDQLKREAISLNELLADLSSGDRPHPNRSIVILDACRDNPLVPPGYKSASNPRGLAGLPDPDGIFVIYAAASNRTALDRLSSSDTTKYSVFTRTLLPLIGRSDLSIQELSYELKDQVLRLAESVGREQRPTYYDGLRGRFCLPGCDGRSAQVTPPPAHPRPAKPAVVPGKQEQPVQPVKNPISSFSTVPSPAMIKISPGSFRRGGSGKDETAVHNVQFIKSFAIARYETTFDEYDRFAQATGRPLPKDEGWGRGSHPVINVTWDDAKAYAEWLSQLTGRGYRLPSEAEWEYAARSGGLDQEWAGTSDERQLKEYAVYDAVSPQSVGSKQPNGLGLSDMSGNVWEWVEDCWHKNYTDAPTDGSAWLETNGGNCGERVIRGGSWYNRPGALRASNRLRLSTDDRYNGLIGFRLAQDLP